MSLNIFHKIILKLNKHKRASSSSAKYLDLEKYIELNYFSNEDNQEKLDNQKLMSKCSKAVEPMACAQPMPHKPVLFAGAKRSVEDRGSLKSAASEECYDDIEYEEVEECKTEACTDYEEIEECKVEKSDTYTELDELEIEKKLKERMEHMSDTFSQYLIYLIQERKMENADVYKRALVDKKTFSKLKNNPEYQPQKLTALCLCVGAKLNLDETKDLLSRAGYALSPCSKTDIIFSYFIENEIYDMYEIDIQLEEHGLPCIIS